jgi:outer membrane lipase/esterase
MTVRHTPSTPQTTGIDLSRRRVLRVGAATGLAAMAGSAALLSGCGSGEIVSALSPSRFISFGDGLSDLGQGPGGTRYTINDGTVNTWADRLASRYGMTLTAQTAGGLGYAQGHAPADALPRTLTAQIDAFVADQTFGPNDVVLINLPMADVLAPLNALKAGTLGTDAALAQITANGEAQVQQMRRLVAAGAKYLVVLGVYDLGRSPYGIGLGLSGLLTSDTTVSSAAITRYNDAFKTTAVDMGANLLFVDTAFLVNRNTANGGSYGFTNVNTAICTTADASTCTSDTLITGATATQYVFADGIHLTPACNQQLGDYAYDQLRGRW